MESVNFSQLEQKLEENQFLGGQAPSAADHTAYEALKSTPPSAMEFPNVFAWFVLVSRFTDAIRATWAPAGGAPAAQKAKKEPTPTPAATKVEEKPKEDDMDDLFGDDDDEEDSDKVKAALAERKKLIEEGKKKVVIAKSLVLFEVKPYEAETDLDQLAQQILKIEVDGCIWKTEYKKEPIAYGVNKLVIGCVIEDDKVSTDDLQEKIEAFEELVQSVDIKSFSKI
eukprot:CAMPEP_0202956260 /NCGR_PEP_ID=MMETSP1396-20130829/769_1 /ASSEMBLY_ACC=CAM_ASM_000872 /TAXON_ID= /ORGANISM="Pseudokeronopsis sp., Strain Brazil" /LENGTH=225 /DNA_ID=CAMNT_0049673191 /DNA_START=31 /DNA_END=708 /DNA_ORIENTATION=-